ncbi:glycosyltransferase [Dyadobacter sp. CY356]|uniref:glycosyltransferase family 2 protein n=1 Tax=Dyadobacter sp. CY356 TaxID=2906442 RepID=UPI001F29019A|nr:glycosyltransferase [Dyadobacter sp. CY356]MCF0059660.1 glycosyltransferase [Dyadobacter sp. CY356]
MVQTFSEETEEDEPVVASTLFYTIPPSQHLKLSVILPVRNEEDNLFKTLEALRNQKDNEGLQLSYSEYEVLLLANNCTDESAEFARSYQKTYPEFSLHVEEIQLTPDVAHIGTVRRLLMDAAYNRFASLNRPQGIIASTDSDSEVDKYWVFNTIEEIKKGNDVVGGRILTRPENSISRVYYLRDITYKHLVSKVEALLDPVANDPWPRHFQCFGASFAVTCSIYDLSGRLPVVPFLEDMAFHRALTRIDARIRLSPLVKVITSTRIQGRVDFGFSIQLKQWGEMNEARDPILVEHAEALFIKLKAKRLLRQYWNCDSDHKPDNLHLLNVVAEILQLDLSWLISQVDSEIYFGVLWERIEEELENGEWTNAWPKMDVVDVINDLKIKIKNLQLQ